MTSTPPLVVVGTGAVGAALARALAVAGWPIDALVSRSMGRAEERRAIVGAGRPLSFDALLAESPSDEPRALLVTVPDRAVADVAAALAQRRWATGTVALHTSGAEPVTTLDALARVGVACGGMHPLKSFVDPESDAVSLAGTVFALEGTAPALAIARALAGRLSAEVFTLEPGARAAWHAAAAHACNHLVALVDQALDLIEHAGLDRDRGRAALLPLLSGTLSNLARHPPGRALTGPVARGELAVLERHLDVLRRAAPDVRDAYRALATRAVALAQASGRLEVPVAARLIECLADLDEFDKETE